MPKSEHNQAPAKRRLTRVQTPVKRFDQRVKQRGAITPCDLPPKPWSNLWSNPRSTPPVSTPVRAPVRAPVKAPVKWPNSESASARTGFRPRLLLVDPPPGELAPRLDPPPGEVAPHLRPPAAGDAAAAADGRDGDGDTAPPRRAASRGAWGRAARGEGLPSRREGEGPARGPDSPPPAAVGRGAARASGDRNSGGHC